MNNPLKISTVALALFCISAGPQGKQEEAKKKAVDAARTWLKLVDDGQYDASWNQGAQYFKKTINQKQWKQALQATRKPLGKTLSRKLKNASYMTSLPGAPDGEYVVIQFDTSFEQKKAAVETITPKLEKDGRWRVSGYFIK